MIKFFRKIRQNLISEGRVGNYLKYAVGEIFLVVIGILIALYISNWNGTRLEKNEVVNYFEQIKVELKSDIGHFNNDLVQMGVWTEYLNKISEGKYDQVDLSRLPISLARNLNPRNFGISYKKLLESGIINHVQDDEIAEKLQVYYLVNCSEYNNRTEFHANFISDHIEGPLLLMLSHKKGFLVDSDEVIQELESGKLMSLVNWQVSYFEYQMPKIKGNIEQAEELIRTIDKK